MMRGSENTQLNSILIKISLVSSLCQFAIIHTFVLEIKLKLEPKIGQQPKSNLALKLHPVKFVDQLVIISIISFSKLHKCSLS